METLNKLTFLFVKQPPFGIDLVVINFVESFAREFHTLGNNFFTQLVEDPLRHFAFGHFHELVNKQSPKGCRLPFKFFVDSFNQHFLLVLAGFVATNTGEQFLVDDHTRHGRWNPQGSVFDIAGLVTKNGSQQFFFRRRIAFSFGCDFTNKNISFPYFRTNADQSVFVEVFGRFFGDIGNIRSEFFFATLGVANLQFKFLNVDRRKPIFTDNTLRNHDRIFKIVPLPWHEGNFEVTAQSKFALLGRIALHQHISLGNLIAHTHQRNVINTGILVGLAELDEVVGANIGLERNKTFLGRTLITHNN